MVGLVAVLGSGVAVAVRDLAAPPSPLEYASHALEVMQEQGYYVDPATWPQARQRALETARAADDYEDTYIGLAGALDVAGGDHSTFLPPGRTLGDRALGDQQPAYPVITSSGEIATLRLPGLVESDPAVLQHYAEAAAVGIRAAVPETACGWIVDLRGNHGGNMWPMLAGLSGLIPDGKVLYFVDRHGRRKTVALRDGSALLDGMQIARVSDGPKINHPVAVLQDGETASSAEAVLLAFHGLPYVRTFGSPSYGYSTANSTIRLHDGATIYLTSAVFADRSGRLYADPIAPDRHVADSTAAEAAAREWLIQACDQR